MTRKIVCLLIGLASLSYLWGQINVQNVDIVRDKWGVPHIFGKTDAEVTYGLAWATCEDDFKTVQHMILASRGRLGEVMGKGGAVLDFLHFIIGAEESVKSAFDTAYSPRYREVLNAYVQGINDYAAAYPKEILLKDVFPVNSQDVIEYYILTNTLLTSVYLDVQKIFQGGIKKYEVNLPQGSNAFAFNTKRTADGKVYLAVNSHQPLEGMFSWYEAHLCSEEGLNILGGTFPGGISILHGSTPNLGWACTLNHPDMCDVYKLDMNPNNGLQYWFDDHWETLQVRKTTVKVKLGAITLPITKKFYWSKYGPTLKNADGFYSLRFVANMDIKSPEQMYWLNKSTNFSEWRNVMRQNHIPGMNFVYADRNDTIFYVSTAEMPYRNPAFDWLNVLPGNTSANLWAPEFLPFDSLPQVLNPSSGYLVNTNNSCFDVSTSADNLKTSCVSPTCGYGTEQNNRSIMAHRLIADYAKLSYEDFKKVKFDRTFNEQWQQYGLQNLALLTKLSPVKYPDLADALEVLNSWNHQCDADNKEVAMITFAMYHLIDIIVARGTSYEANTFSERTFVEALRHAKRHMLKHFGSLRVPLGQVQKHVRGNVELPIGGAPEVLAATITSPYKKGMRKTSVGESYIQLVRFSKDSVEVESINAFGSSAKPESSHYTDQMVMFVNQELKPMTFNKAAIYKEAEQVYKPTKDKNNKAKEGSAMVK